MTTTKHPQHRHNKRRIRGKRAAKKWAPAKSPAQRAAAKTAAERLAAERVAAEQAAAASSPPEPARRSKSLSCRFGWHHWESKRAEAQSLRECTQCGRPGYHGWYGHGGGRDGEGGDNQSRQLWPMSNQVRADHSGRLCAAELEVLLRGWAPFSPGWAMTWALDELLCRGHFVRLTDNGAGVPGRFVGYRVTIKPVPRSARPALASFAPLFDGHPRDITPERLARYVAQEFGDKLEVEDGYPCGSPQHWYERCVVDPLRAEGLVSVCVEQALLGSLQLTRNYLEPTADGEAVAARYRDILSNRHRRDWRRPWRESEPVVPGDIDIAVATLQRSQRTRSRERLFFNDDVGEAP
ncbi:hypothetical protein ASH01_17860 [Terrabacter sp. Soil811]|uniref:hypothetical protein n=1 Tax=Terrabacter sp. Soil811 TaxID=1736419 RepID=UPI0006FB66C1|nr:hypothetical protein [Terrabacter sp. Soil811]KRF41946.1 hypothetical protein ASH01_17860 [Terrabacter sp. Soil811]